MALTTMACGDDRTIIEQGQPGPQGEQGPKGDSAEPITPVDVVGSNQPVVVELTASRDYDPSVFNPATEELGPSAIRLPEEIELVQGVAGTGFASLTLNDVKFCYQGTGINNSDPGTAFKFKGIATGNECHMGTTSGDLDFVSYFDNVVITLTINGGGVHPSIRTLTVGSIEILYIEFN